MDYHDIEEFPVSTVTGHKGRVVLGMWRMFRWYACRVESIIYQGDYMIDVVLPVRLMKLIEDRSFVFYKCIRREFTGLSCRRFCVD